MMPVPLVAGADLSLESAANTQLAPWCSMKFPSDRAGRGPAELQVVEQAGAARLVAVVGAATPGRLGCRLAMDFRDLPDQYSEHGIELVKGNVEGSLVCRRR